ncbi:MAG TPA: phage holin family protein, partial [Anaerolineae bacterium]
MNLKDLLLALWNDAAVQLIVAGVVLNVVVAVAAAIKSNNFQLARIGEFLYRKLLPYLMVYAVARLLGDAAGVPGLATAVWAIITVTLAGELTANLANLGIEMPEMLKKRTDN